MDGKSLQDLLQQMEWADAEVWRAVLSCPEAARDKKLLDYLHHLHAVQLSFLRAWRGEPFDVNFPEFSNAGDMMKWAQESYAKAHAFVAHARDEQLAQVLVLPWVGFVEQRMGQAAQATTLGETIIQVAMHSAYHRGQVNARLREVGGTPPLVDYIFWVWLGRPATAWPALD